MDIVLAISDNILFILMICYFSEDIQDLFIEIWWSPRANWLRKITLTDIIEIAWEHTVQTYNMESFEKKREIRIRNKIIFTILITDMVIKCM